MTLAEPELERLRGINERIDIDEVAADARVQRAVTTLAVSGALVTSVCTGAFLLGDAGLSAYLLAQLDDLRSRASDRSLVVAVRRAVADALAQLRTLRACSPQPLVTVITTSSSLDPSHPVLETGALVLTTAAAAPAVRKRVPTATEVVGVNAGETVDLAAALAELRRRGCSVVLSEGGPGLFGGLVAARLVDELFLTLSPLVAGRGMTLRPGLVEGIELLPEFRVDGTLRSIRTHGSHLFLRYSLS